MNPTFKKYLEKYRAQLIPIFLVTLSLFILLQVTIPQVSQIAELTKTRDGKQEDIDLLSQSITSLSQVDPISLEQDLSLTTTALPLQKDLSLIFSSLTSAAGESGTVVQSFSLEVGNVYSQQKPTDQMVASQEGISKPRDSGFLTLEIAARIQGPDAASLVAFARAVQNSLPLAEVTEITMSDTDARLIINYFYRPVDIAGLSRRNTIVPLKASEQEVLQKLREMSN